MTSPTVVAPTVKPGWKTTELYATLAPIVLTALTFAFHRDFSGYVQAAGLAVSGLAAAAYAISRAHLKRPVDLATLLFDVKALLPIGKEAAAVAATVKAATPKKAPATP
jgi:hypothetical protein